MGDYQEVISFWRNAGYQKWFARDDAFDAEFRQCFESAHFTAARGEHEAWMDSAEGALALQILLLVVLLLPALRKKREEVFVDEE